jgi:hypothetical protein
MAGALFLGPRTLEAQAPVVLVCQDGTTQPGSSKVACADHKGMDWEATKVWSEMRAGHFAEADSVVCTDGQRQVAARNACRKHGGVDSVSTMAAVRRRAKAERYGGENRAEASADSTRSDSTKWGYPVNRNPQEQNPPGYRGMERPAGLSGDSTAVDSSSARNSSSSQRGAGTTADSIAKSSSSSQRGAGTTADSIAKSSSSTQRGAATPADTGSMSRSDTVAMGRETSSMSRDSTDVVHRQRSVPPGTEAAPPPYTPDSEKVWVRNQPQGDSVAVPDSGIRADSGR